MPVKSIPKGYHTVTPYLTVQGAATLLEFLQRAFDMVEQERFARADGTIGHAEVRVGDSVIMVAEARGEWKPMPGTLYVYVKDTDATYRRGLEAGASSLMEPADQFYTDRNAGVRDPVGNLWWIATHKEDISPEELARRATAVMR
jgi:uncharacterized glyoxalase superfamily protein PhnB